VVKEGTQDPDSWYRWEIRFGAACVGIGQWRSKAWKAEGADRGHERRGMHVKRIIQSEDHITEVLSRMVFTDRRHRAQARRVAELVKSRIRWSSSRVSGRVSILVARWISGWVSTRVD
jgi:hypothetical protein